MQESEIRVKEKYEELGYTVLRNGWPDFLAVSPEGELLFVEVKPVERSLSGAQQAIRRALEEAGLEYVVEWQLMSRTCVKCGREFQGIKGAPLCDECGQVKIDPDYDLAT